MSVLSCKLAFKGQSLYLTGLLDCVGEIKRLEYDRMHSGKAKDAEKLFTTMEEIYKTICPFAVYDNWIQAYKLIRNIDDFIKFNN